jgi:hypothetical protein
MQARDFSFAGSSVYETVLQAVPMGTVVEGKIWRHGLSILTFEILVPDGKFLTCR